MPRPDAGRVLRDVPGPLQVEGPEPAGYRLGDIEGRPVRRQADAVGAVHREQGLADRRAVDGGMEDAGAVLVAPAPLAMIGEPDAAIGVEHEVVRPLQRLALAGAVHCLDGAGGRVHRLDAAAAIVVRLQARHQQAVALQPLEAAVVAQPDPPVRPQRGTVGAAAGLGHHRHPAIRGRPARGCRGRSPPAAPSHRAWRSALPGNAGPRPPPARAVPRSGRQSWSWSCPSRPGTAGRPWRCTARCRSRAAASARCSAGATSPLSASRPSSAVAQWS